MAPTPEHVTFDAADPFRLIPFSEERIVTGRR
jgi:hypothetical protein